MPPMELSTELITNNNCNIKLVTGLNHSHHHRIRTGIVASPSKLQNKCKIKKISRKKYFRCMQCRIVKIVVKL